MKAALIGSNFITLSVALRLANFGANVTIFEKSSTHWGGAWKLKDILGWKKRELAWHVILFKVQDKEQFEEYFQYFDHVINYVGGANPIIDNSFFSPKHLVPEGGISKFITEINDRASSNKNISFNVGRKVESIKTHGRKLSLTLSEGIEYFDEVYFNSCVDLEHLNINGTKLALPFHPRVATHILMNFESKMPFRKISHLMHLDEVKSDYVFDLIGQLGNRENNHKYESLIVFRVKRENISQMNENMNEFIENAKNQIIRLLSFQENTKMSGYQIDRHRTSYRKDLEMRETMRDVPECINWIPTQDLSKTIPFIVKNIWSK